MVTGVGFGTRYRSPATRHGRSPGGVGLLTHEKFVGFCGRPLADPRRATGALFTLGVESREAVDAMVHQAAALGGTPAHEPQDHGFMSDWSFYDLDGHGWGVIWMDPAAMQG